MRSSGISSLVECIKSKDPGEAILGLTGRPGVGKSTIFLSIVDTLRRLGCRVGGISAPEVRGSGGRLGFKIVDIMSGSEGWLSRRGVGPPGAPRVGRYYVVVDDVVRVGVGAIESALREAHIIGIDEIGPMELAVGPLRDAIVKALASGKPKVVVYHRRLPSSHPEVYRVVARGCIVEVTIDNRGLLRREAGRLAEALASKASCG
ncbi:MAG: nucleoside-triphosphatase [Desulfurococcales archaeon]|nr:nucleoside-triphosphatase [Desulfurococcales archaeon]